MFDLNNGRDFPYYNGIPRMAKLGWLILLICLPVSYLLGGMVSDISSEIIGNLVFLLLLLIPTLYFSNWDYTLIFQKPTKNELLLAVLMFLAYVAYSSIFSNLLPASIIPAAANGDANVISILALVFLLMAEELMKFIPLMFFLRVFFKYTANRRLSIIASSIITLTYFGLIHSIDGSSVISALLIQGAG